MNRRLILLALLLAVAAGLVVAAVAIWAGLAAALCAAGVSLAVWALAFLLDVGDGP